MPSNIINFLDYKKKRNLEVRIEDLDVRVCTYNFLKKLKVRTLSELNNLNWLEQAKIHSKSEYILEDLHNLMLLPKEA